MVDLLVLVSLVSFDGFRRDLGTFQLGDQMADQLITSLAILANQINHLEASQDHCRLV